MASSSGNYQRYPNGYISELFHFPTAAVMLLDYDEKKTVRLLGLGVFHVRLVVQTTPPPPLMTTYCSVNGFQWGMAKDAPIMRMSERSFIFGFPGLLYALQFPSVCHDSHLLSLQKVFMKFGHYINFCDPSFGGPGYYPCADNEPGIWSIVRPLAEPKAHEVLVHFGHKPGRLVNMSPHMISCYTRATRMSSATKAIVNGLVSGTLRPIHIAVFGTDGGESLCLMPVPPSISVFTCMVDSIEAAWMCSMGVPSALLDLNLNNHNPGFRVWRLTEMGILTFAQELDSANNIENEEQMVTVKTEIGDREDNDKEKEGSSKDATSSSNAAMVHGKGKTKP